MKYTRGKKENRWDRCERREGEKPPIYFDSKDKLIDLTKELRLLLVEETDRFVSQFSNMRAQSSRANRVGFDNAALSHNEQERKEKMDHQNQNSGVGLKTNRSLLKWIVFGVLTLGIYVFVMLHCMARDINQICEGDGRHTAGLLKYILFCIITCGIYGHIWNYSVQERMADNASRYGVAIREGGATILLWSILGSLLCLIGPFVAIHIMLSSLNKLSRAYNEQNGLVDA